MKRQRISKRRFNYEYYFKNLSGFKGITFLQEGTNVFSNRWLSTIVISNWNNEDASCMKISKYLGIRNIETRPLWKPMHLQPLYEGYPTYLNGVSEDLFKFGLCLPSGSALTQSELDRIIGEVYESLNS